MLTVLISPNSNKDEYRVIPSRDGNRLFVGTLEVGETSKGPRPKKFRVRRDGDEELQKPDDFIDLVRMADEIVLTQSGNEGMKDDVRELLSAYQLESREEDVCRYCLIDNEYTPLGYDRIKHGDEFICPDCAKQELRREVSYKGDLSSSSSSDSTSAAIDRMYEILMEVRDLEKVVGLLNSSLDPELTKFDEISENVETREEIRLDDLPLRDEFRSLLPFDTLLPVQSKSVENGLLDGEDQLVVSATATGKTLIGELAGIQRALEGKGKTLFLVPLVALANQKYSRFNEDYSGILDVTQRVGSNRIYGGEESFDPSADVVVGTYEGIDHALRTGRDLGEIGTVVIDEVHNLMDDERGHRLDGLITRLRHYTGEVKGSGTDTDTVTDTQWIFLSATVGNPVELSEKLNARLVEYEDRPVPIERHLTFASRREKPDIINRLVKREYNKKSSKGYRGQTIVFTNSRRRCHKIAGKIDTTAAAYHAGLSSNERKQVERYFGEGEISTVVTTAALGAGVDFPASQVIFESLAMGIDWLTVQEFEQMLGRAGRPDYHDRGVVYLLAEIDGVYHRSMERTEEEVAVDLLKGEMGGVAVEYDSSAVMEETLANLAAGGDDYASLNDDLMYEIDTDRAVSKLREYGLMRNGRITEMGRIGASHFLTPKQVETMEKSARREDPPHKTVAELELLGDEM
ncbi:DEAD/DEAH box helicase [Halorutilales archaeon Cl-col2-1]